MKTIVIGDIHGGFKALRQLLESAHLGINTKYIFVGDYVDGWSESAEVVSFLIEFSQIHHCVFIRGNHDELLYTYLRFGVKNPEWLAQGGESSIKSYAGISAAEKEKHLLFFQNLVNFHIDFENRLFVHAGFIHQNEPNSEHFPNVVYWDRTLWEMVCAMDLSISPNDDRYPKRLKQFEEIYIGHTPVTRLGFDKPTNFANVWNVDTGAAFNGKISMMDVDTKEIWQSDSVSSFYPNEKGRN